MTPRLTSAVMVSALIRRIGQEGGSAMVLAKGDEMAGGILVLALEKGANPRFYERGVGAGGDPALLPSGPRELPDESAVADYWQRRRNRDSDLWVIELDIAQAERFIAETMGLH